MAEKSGRIRKKKVSYTIVGNTALRDERLSLKAKGLLALIESYLSLENFILYKDYLMKKSSDGVCSFNNAWNELKNCGYLIQYKLRDEKNQYYYEYEICDSPDIENQYVGKSPHTENPHMENKGVELPQDDFQGVGKQYDGKSTSGKPPQYNKYLSSKDLLNKDIYTNKQTVLTENIRKNIDYDVIYANSINKNLVDEIISIIVSVLLCDDNEYITINKNKVSTNIVKGMFVKINMSNINYVLNVVENCTEHINNMRSFIISTLYNSIQTLNLYYTNRVAADFNDFYS